MRILLAPAKKMNEELDSLAPVSLPVFLEETCRIQDYIAGLSLEEAQHLWDCNENIAALNFARHRAIGSGEEAQVNLTNQARLAPAILTYDGIAYQYMAPAVMEGDQLNYLQDHLRILSGFYGVLRPMDGVTPYRLEMQAKAAIGDSKNLYGFWGRKLYDAVRDESGVMINLASKEYSKCVEKYLTPEDRYITCVFGELKTDKSGAPKVVQKGVYAKMARGEMVRYLAELQSEDPCDMKGFDRLGYGFREDLSSETEYVFIKN